MILIDKKKIIVRPGHGKLTQGKHLCILPPIYDRLFCNRVNDYYMSSNETKLILQGGHLY